MKQLPALWRLLAYISMEMSTLKAIKLLSAHRKDLAKAKNVDDLDLVCTSVIKASTYPINTALYMSMFMNDLAHLYDSRKDEFQASSSKYIDVAMEMIDSVSSDHLLALLVEVPSDIYNMNVLDMVIQFGLDDFCHTKRPGWERMEVIITRMNQHFQVLGPSARFGHREMSTYKVTRYC